MASVVPQSAGSPPITGSPARRSRLKTSCSGRQLRDDLGERAGPADRLQADDERRDARREQGGQRIPIADSGIDPEIDAERAEWPDRANSSAPAGDGVEIGEVELAEAEAVAKRAGDAERLGIRVQPRPQRLIMIAVATDRMDGPARLQVEDRDHPERHERAWLPRCQGHRRRRSWSTNGSPAADWPARPCPRSWAAEGHAMRRAIAGDFASLPGVRVIVTLDERFAERTRRLVVVPVGRARGQRVLQRLAAEADYTVLIAPETGGVLAERTRAIDGRERPRSAPAPRPSS